MRTLGRRQVPALSVRGVPHRLHLIGECLSCCRHVGISPLSGDCFGADALKMLSQVRRTSSVELLVGPVRLQLDLASNRTAPSCVCGYALDRLSTVGESIFTSPSVYPSLGPIDPGHGVRGGPDSSAVAQ